MIRPFTTFARTGGLDDGGQSGNQHRVGGEPLKLLVLPPQPGKLRQQGRRVPSNAMIARLWYI